MCSGKAQELTNSTAVSKCLSHFQSFPFRMTCLAKPCDVEGSVESHHWRVSWQNLWSEGKGHPIPAQQAVWNPITRRVAEICDPFLHGWQLLFTQPLLANPAHRAQDGLFPIPSLLPTTLLAALFPQASNGEALSLLLLQDLVDNSVLFTAPLILAT